MSIQTFIQEYWTYLTIPLVSAVVGYVTNWLAVRMMMWPLEFKGIGPIGWQGVVPANAGKMARVVVDHSIKRVLSQDELLERVDAVKWMEEVNYRLEPIIEDIVDQVMSGTSNYGLPVGNFMWSAAPAWVKNKVYAQVKGNLPDVLESIVEDMRENADELMDINEVIIEKLGDNKQMLVDIFMTAAHREFKFIERSGFYFGFPLGIPVMFIWYFYPSWWLLPLFGGLVGYITNAVAIYMVQKPLNPVKLGPFILQGLFIKRQKEVSRYYGEVFANDLITAEVVIGEMMKKPSSVERLRQLIQHEVKTAIEESQGLLKPLTVVSMGPKEYAKISHIISERAFDEFQNLDKRAYRQIDKMFDIENTIAERVGNLPPEEFFELLHPVIAEDEWKLIAVGAVLGLCAGFWQLALLT
jgi:uncharacterized membrane protein YheB (UPF0754 family)